MPTPKPVPLFFAFPDGVFDYVCAECDALCCKGQGFGGNLNREMAFLLKQYPALGSMANTRHRDYIDISSPAGKCYFLQPDNLCQIETEHGRDKKPGVCMIFPFNRFRRIGNTVAVSPHFMCPLRVKIPSRPGEVTGTHATIEATIRESEMLDPKYVEWYMRGSKASPDHTKAILTRETRFRDDCAAALGRASFTELLATHSEDPVALNKFIKRTARLMNWRPSPENGRDYIDDVLIATASSFRMDMLDATPERMIRFLGLAERVLRPLFALSTVPPKPQAICTVVQSSQALLRLLSRGDDTVNVRQKAKSAAFGHPDLVFASLLTLRDISSIGVLKALENGFKRLPTASDRAVLANHVAAQVTD